VFKKCGAYLLILVLFAALFPACASPTRSVIRGRNGGGALARSLARVDVAAPLLLGLGLYASGWDDDLSDAIAGSATGDLDQVNLNNRRAYDDASQAILYASPLLWVVPTLASHTQPALHVRDEVPAATARRLAVGSGATLATYATGYALKEGVGRRRPDEPDNLAEADSFPSGHTYLTSVAATLSRHELGRSTLSARAKKRLSWAVTAVPIATAYLRVRTKRHYVSDVLVGYTFGSFWGHLANEVFLSPADPIVPYFNLRRVPGAAELRLGVTFDL
jgi:membrane-associated phospholipid phosphatase